MVEVDFPLENCISRIDRWTKVRELLLHGPRQLTNHPQMAAGSPEHALLHHGKFCQ